MDTPSEKEKREAVQYKVSARLENEHSETATITSVAFSPRVSHLACAGDDGKISVWDTHTGKLLYVFVGRIPVLSIAWINSKQFASGMRNGMLFVGTVDEVSLELRALTFSGHKDAILCVSAQEDGTLCATGAGDEIKIWEPRKIVWDRQRDLILPTGTGPEVRVGALCWGHCHGQLFATYLHHGVVLWDVNNGNILRRLANIRSSSRYISLSPPEATTPDLLAVSNATSGFDIYNQASSEPSATFQDRNVQQGSACVSLPVLQIHGGNLILGGSNIGRVHIWDAKRPTQKAIQILRHTDSLPVTSLAFTYDFNRDVFFIATVTKRRDHAPIVFIWRGQGQDKPVEELDSSHYTVWRHTLRIWKDYWWIVLGFLGASVALMGLIVTGFVQNMRRV